jgi:hypothetical protein
VAEYASVASVGVESFDWGKQGDEWVHRVSECMAETDGFSVTGHKYDDTTRPFIEFTGARRSGATLDTRLVIIPREAGVFIAVASKAEELDEAAADAWAQAARCATLRLGASATEYHWTAIIAPPAIRITGAEPPIEGEANVGVFRLVSTGQPLHERMPPQLPSFSSTGSGVSWPILVEARHTGYNWAAALQKAAFDLHRLCALLSLVLGECLVVREAPAPVTDGVRRAPNRVWWQHWPEDFDASTAPEPRNVKTIPDWVSSAWQQMNNRPQLGHAVAVHHEGLRVQFEHPSLALIAFVASIEAVANLLLGMTAVRSAALTRMWLLGFAQRSVSWRQMKRLGAWVLPTLLDHARSTKDGCMVGRRPRECSTSVGVSTPYASSTGWSGGCVVRVVSSFRALSAASCPHRGWHSTHRYI